MSLGGWLLAPLAFTVDKTNMDTVTERVIEKQQAWAARLGAGFLPGMIGALLTGLLAFGFRILDRTSVASTDALSASFSAQHQDLKDKVSDVQNTANEALKIATKCDARLGPLEKIVYGNGKQGSGQ